MMVKLLPACGLVPADKLITHVVPLEGVGKAFGTAAAGEGLKKELLHRL